MSDKDAAELVSIVGELRGKISTKDVQLKEMKVKVMVVGPSFRLFVFSSFLLTSNTDCPSTIAGIFAKKEAIAS